MGLIPQPSREDVWVNIVPSRGLNLVPVNMNTYRVESVAVCIMVIRYLIDVALSDGLSATVMNVAGK